MTLYFLHSTVPIRESIHLSLLSSIATCFYFYDVLIISYYTELGVLSVLINSEFSEGEVRDIETTQ